MSMLLKCVPTEIALNRSLLLSGTCTEKKFFGYRVCDSYEPWNAPGRGTGFESGKGY